MEREVSEIGIGPNVKIAAWSDGDPTSGQLMVRDGAQLPRLCVDCGAACTGEPIVRKYRGFAPGAWWLFLFKAGLRSLLVRLFGRVARVGAFVCDAHARSRRTKRIVGLLGLLLSPVVLVAMIMADMSKGATGFTFLAWTITALIVRIGGTDYLDVQGITKEREAVFNMPSEEFARAAVQTQEAPAIARVA